MINNHEIPEIKSSVKKRNVPMLSDSYTI